MGSNPTVVTMETGKILPFGTVKVGDVVYDDSGYTGVVEQIEDIHNVWVEYSGGGGSGCYCLDALCASYDPLYKLK